jgi:P27 family predicted phage terminase small subunit
MVKPRVPSELKKLRGTDQPCRMNAKEPAPVKGFPVAPAHLSPEEVYAWQQVTQLADSMGILTIADVFAVEELATAYANLLSLRKRIKEEGDLYEKRDITGETMKRVNPLVGLEQTQRKDFMQLLGKFGLTPSDRSKVSTVDKAPDMDDLSMWVK